MIRPIVYYGHPVLRTKGDRIASLTPDLQQLIDDMFETMYDAAGVGLAAQQVGQALQLTVIDVRGVENRPSSMSVDGQPVEVETRMPLVLINPEIKPHGQPATGPEGCLSFPEIYADITRPELVDVRATGRDGEVLHFQAGGLLARAVQHEFDHLQGILFIDRMTTPTKHGLKPQLEKLRLATVAALKKAESAG